MNKVKKIVNALLTTSLMLAISINSTVFAYSRTGEGDKKDSTVKWSKVVGLKKAKNGYTKVISDNLWGNAWAVSKNAIEKGLDGRVVWKVANAEDHYKIGIIENANLQSPIVAIEYRDNKIIIGKEQSNIDVELDDEVEILKKSNTLEVKVNGNLVKSIDVLNTDTSYRIFSMLNKGQLPLIKTDIGLPISINAKINPLQGSSDGEIALDITGGSGEYDINWLEVASSNKAISNLAAGKYSVEVTDRKTGVSYSKVYNVGYDVAWIGNNTSEEELNNNTWGQKESFSANGISAEQNGSISWIYNGLGDKQAYALGLSGLDLKGSYNSIEYSFLLEDDAVSINELGLKKWNTNSLEVGDELRIEKEGNKINYFINQDKVYSSKASSKRAYFADFSAKGEFAAPSISISQKNEEGSKETLAVDLNKNKPLDKQENTRDDSINENNVLEDNAITVRAYKVKTEGVSNATQLNIDNANLTETVYDALGNESALVKRSATPSLSDDKVKYEYNEMGLKTSQVHGNSKYAVNKNEFENSPLARVSGVVAPGKDWVGKGNLHAKDFVQRPNNILEDGTITSFNVVDGNLSLSNLNFGEGDLWVNAIKDENESNSQSLIYTDKKDRVIVKRAQKGVNENGTADFIDTYFVYDDLGRLTYVIPPKAAKEVISEIQKSNLDKLVGSNLVESLSLESIKDAFYSYKYDSKNRVVESKAPGAEKVLYVYNKQGNLALVQDAGLRVQNQNWIYSKYDAKGRKVLEGIYENPDALSAQQLQSLLDEDEGMVALISSGHANNLYGYYDSSFPSVTESTVLKAFYFDNYTNVDNNFDASFNAVVGYETSYKPFARVRGKKTGALVKVLDGSDQMISEAYFYDIKGNLIQTVAKNHLGGVSTTTSKYSFGGNLEAELDHITGLETVEILKKFEYDHAGRLTKVIHKVNDNEEETLATYSYNEDGLLAKKVLGDNAQEIDYSYNERGWLISTNNTEEKPSAKKLFAEEVRFSDAVLNPYYNGNVAASIWNTASDNLVRSYAYSYDELNQVIDAEYNYKNVSSSWDQTLSEEKYGVSRVRYDEEGNLLLIARESQLEDGKYTLVDVLNMDYTVDGKLKSVSDLSPYQSSGKDFKGKSSESAKNSYTFSSANSLTKDSNDKVSSITYDVFGRLREIKLDEENKVTYTYDALGRKLSREVEVKENEKNIVKRYDFVGDVSFKDEELSEIYTAEGRVLNDDFYTEGEKELIYEYHYNDHDDNFRLAFIRPRAWEMTAEMDQAKEEESFFANLKKFRNQKHAYDGFKGVKLKNSDFENKKSFVYTKSIPAKEGFKLFASVKVVSDQLRTQPSNAPVGITNNPLLVEETKEFTGTSVKQVNSFNILGALSNKLNKPKATVTKDEALASYTQDAFSDNEAVLRIELLDETGKVQREEIERIFPNNVWEEITTSIDVSHENLNDDWTLRVSVMSFGSSATWFDELEIDEIAITQENHYSPFGVELAGLCKKGNPAVKMNFDGAEQEDIKGLNWLVKNGEIYNPYIASKVSSSFKIDNEPLKAHTENLKKEFIVNKLDKSAFKKISLK